MNLRIAVIALVTNFTALAADVPMSFEEAATIWEKSRDTIAYQNYAAEFAQLNNLFRLDERDGCYSLPDGPVNLMLLISSADDKGVATVERVFYDPDTAKARCFQRSYRGVPTKPAPFAPFVLQLRME